MIIKKLEDVPFSDLKGYENVEKQIVIGPEDGSTEIIMRYFTLKQGGMSPYHTHDFPHVVKIEEGTGVVIDSKGNEKPLKKGDYIYIDDNEKHQLRNTGPGNFNFICIVPERGEE